MLYFAYGSNMSLPRLRARTPGARQRGIGALSGHRLRWHKLSEADGSGKCDVQQTGQHWHWVLGVLYDIPAAERRALDRAEGLGVGYAVKEVDIELAAGYSQRAFTYYALLTDPSLKPFDWYREHVLRGAREHRLPGAYLRRLGATPVVADPDRLRHRRELAIYDGGP